MNVCRTHVHGYNLQDWGQSRQEGMTGIRFQKRVERLAPISTASQKGVVNTPVLGQFPKYEILENGCVPKEQLAFLLPHPLHYRVCRPDDCTLRKDRGERNIEFERLGYPSKDTLLVRP